MDKLAALTQILQQNPTDAFARYGLAMELVAQSRIPEALAEFDRCLLDNPDYVPAYQMSAQLLLKLARLEEARARLELGLAAAARTGNSHAQSELQTMLDDLGA